MLRAVLVALCAAMSLDAQVEALTRAARLLRKAERAHARGAMERHDAAVAAAEQAMASVEHGWVAALGLGAGAEEALDEQAPLQAEEVEALLQWQQELERFLGEVNGRPVVIGADEETLAGRPVVAWPADAPNVTASRTAAIMEAVDKAPSAAHMEALAEWRRAGADGVDAATEAWYHTLILHFRKRRGSEQEQAALDDTSGVGGLTGFTIAARRDRALEKAKTAKKKQVQQLGRDFMLLRRARQLSDEELAAVLENEAEEDQRNLVNALIGQRAARARKDAGVRKAVVFSCAFGDGHKSAAAAVKQYLAAPARGEPADDWSNYEVEVIDTTKDPRFLVEAWYNALGIRDEDLFNQVVLRGQWYALHNLFDKVMDSVFGQLVPRCPSPGCDNARKQQFRAALLQIQPELVVTVYHMELMPVLELARELGGLPHVHIATDMDIKMHEVFTSAGPAPVYPRFKTSVPFDVEKSYETLTPLSTEPGDPFHFLSGYPVRAPFLLPPQAPEELQAIRNARYPGCAGAKGCLLVLVMTGGGGQDVPFPYTLANSGYLEDQDQPVHVLVIAGGNNKLHGEMQQKLKGRHEFAGKTLMMGNSRQVTVEVVQDPKNLVVDEQRPANGKRPYYVLEDELALLMDLSDVIITKPGGGTTAEVAYRRLPAVFDATKGLLHWEGFTVDVFVDAGRGVKLDKAPLVHWPSFPAKQLSSALKEAWAMGKTGANANLAQDPELPEGEVLQPRKHIRKAVHEAVENTRCVGCKVFADDVAPPQTGLPTKWTAGRARAARVSAPEEVQGLVARERRGSAGFVELDAAVELDHAGSVRRQV